MTDARPGASVATLVLRRDAGGTRWEKDSLVAEEPLEIRLKEGEAEPERFVVTMRTPGDDDDLVIGLLFWPSNPPPIPASLRNSRKTSAS